eukprot:3056644-Pleurochrysis_carterae.AAC.2
MDREAQKHRRVVEGYLCLHAHHRACGQLSAPEPSSLADWHAQRSRHHTHAQQPSTRSPASGTFVTLHAPAKVPFRIGRSCSVFRRHELIIEAFPSHMACANSTRRDMRVGERRARTHARTHARAHTPKGARAWATDRRPQQHKRQRKAL